MSTGSPDKFVYKGGEFTLSQCAYCKHLVPGPAAVCDAFPGSIPADILANWVDHRRPYIDPATGEPGDRGVALGPSILFEPRDSITPKALAALYRVLDETH